MSNFKIKFLDSKSSKVILRDIQYKPVSYSVLNNLRVKYLNKDKLMGYIREGVRALSKKYPDLSKYEYTVSQGSVSYEGSGYVYVQRQIQVGYGLLENLFIRSEEQGFTLGSQSWDKEEKFVALIKEINKRIYPGFLHYSVLKDTDLKDCAIKDTYEDEYDRLLNKAYKGKELGDFYDLNYKLANIFEEVYNDLNYPLDSDWFISESVLKDDSKMKDLYEAVRDRVIEALNNNELKLDNRDHDTLKDIFNIKYTFVDRKYVKDDFEADPDYKNDEVSEDEGVSEDDLQEVANSNEISEDDLKDPEEEENYKLINSTCKEYLEEFENKIKKTDPKWYLIQMALDKDKGWAYIKDPEKLRGEVELDVVTPKNAKKILKMAKEYD